MSQKVFVPITDELLYDHPERITAPLRPFVIGQPCFHWMAVIEPVDADVDAESTPQNEREAPVLRRVYTGSRFA